MILLCGLSTQSVSVRRDVKWPPRKWRIKCVMAHPIWPLFDLELRTPRLRMFVAGDDDLTRLYGNAAGAVHDPDQMPFSVTWTRGESPERERLAMQWQWSIRSNLKPEAWHIELTVEYEGQLVGSQGLFAENFAITRQVTTGSWLLKSLQGRGIGKEMRAAILFFAFETLGADTAATDVFDWNQRSIGVTRALGYHANGVKVGVLDGRRTQHNLYLLRRDQWEERARSYVPVEVSCPEEVLPLLGAS